MKRIFTTVTLCMATMLCHIYAIQPIVIYPQNTNPIELKYREMSTEDGLPSNYIINMVQDPQGYIWMATANGLCRYDGYSFDVIRHAKEGNNALLLNDRIRELHQNPNGLLFIRLQGERYSCYDTNTRQFVDFTTTGDYSRNYCNCNFTPSGDTWLSYNYTGCIEVKYNNGVIESHAYNKENGTLRSNNILFVFPDSENRVWIGTDQGLYVKENGQLSCIDEHQSFTCATECNGEVYFATGENFLLHADKNKKLKTDGSSFINLIAGHNILGLVSMGKRLVIITTGTTYDYDTTNGHITPSEVQLPGGTVYRDNIGNEYVGDKSVNLCYFDKKNDKTYLFHILDPKMLNKRGVTPYKVVTDREGKIWISSIGNGLMVYDTVSQQLSHFTPHANGNSPIRTDYLYSMLYDRIGNIWISQENLGISVITTMPRYVQRVYATDHQSPKYTNYFRMLRQTSDGRIWAGDFMGGAYILQSDFTLKPISIGVDDDLLAVCIDKDGNTWIGTRHQGLSVNGRFYKSIPGDDSSIAPGKIFDIVCDKRKRVWIAVNTGALCLAIPQADGTYRFKRFLQEDPFMRTVTVVHQAKSGLMFVGCANGLMVFNPDELVKNTKSYYYYNGDNSSLGYSEIRDIIEDEKGDIWFTSVGGGLYHIKSTADPAKITFEQFTTEQGLADNTANSIVMDKKGDLWVGTDYGLSRFNRNTEQFTNYFFANDKLGEIYSENSACMRTDGTLVFATNNGIVCFHPDQITVSNTDDVLVITNLLVNGSTPVFNDQDAQDIHEQRYSLSHRQNSLTFRFSDMKFDFPHKTEYIYWLEGYDREWSQPTRSNEAIYKDLEPGRYTFHVKKLDNRENKEVVMKVTIRQPWWNTWWAWIIYIIVIGGIAWYIFRLLRITYHMKDRIRMDRKISEFKQRFFMDVSHEFRTPLTLIKGSMERMQKAGDLPTSLKQPISNMSKSTDRLLRLINQLLEFHKMESGKLALKLQETDIIKFLRDATMSFTDMAHNRQVNLQFIPFTQKYMLYVDRDYLDKIIYNLVSNSFKYTPKRGDITVRIRCEDPEKADFIEILVEDTGVGVPKDMQQKLFTRFMRTNMSTDSMGIGLNFTEQLVLAHHGEISYHDREGGGSVFTVSLPNKQDVYQPEDYITDSELDEDLKEEEADMLLKSYKELAPVPMNNRRVLVVEDDEDVRDYLKNELAPYFHVTTANDGVEALEMIHKENFDLLISDIKMPQMDGLELLKKVRADDDIFDIPVILLTAMNSIEKQLQSMRYGADDYIPKPFSPALLIGRSIALIQQRDKLRQAYTQTKGKDDETLHPSDNNQQETNAPLISSERDRKFREIIDMKIQKNLSNPDFVVDDLAQSTGYGRSQFYSKMLEITGKTPKEYIREQRMTKAAQQLRSGHQITVAEVAYQVGFSDPLYFSRCFKQYFGMTPSKYQKG